MFGDDNLDAVAGQLVTQSGDCSAWFGWMEKGRYDFSCHERLYERLPNGLHDADLNSFQVDYAKRQLTLEVVAWVSAGEPRELYRPARITYYDLEFVSIEPPRNRAELNVSNPVWIDAGIFYAKDERVAGFDLVVPVNWVFLRDFNSFIFFTAGGVVVEWTGPEEVRS